MDRYEVPIDDHLAPLVEAAERGDDVVITKNGRDVARLAAPAIAAAGRFDIPALERMQACVQALGVEPFDAAATIRALRDEGY